ncbi:MAG: Smr/MutS family protein [Proteobacteria bacterium]|nr:Smr/MutS family protein [Pseudomonadota bacterium]
MKKKKEDIFNPLFKGLHPKIDSPEEEVHDLPLEPPERSNGHEEMDPFLEAMSDVKPLQEDKRRMALSREANVRPSHPAPDDQKKGLAHLQRLVNGTLEIDITFTDEYIEGSVKGFSRKLMRKLKRGEIPVRDFIDLHGLTKQEAEIQVRDFLLRSFKSGLRCVLIVHGRGLNSPDSLPVLKEGLPLWFNRGSTRRIVLAFATARPYDGGTGAIYVLLRRR